MTKQELKNLFSHFQNLNLIVLIEDLKRGLVAREAWVKHYSLSADGSRLCPIAHGWKHPPRSFVGHFVGHYDNMAMWAASMAKINAASKREHLELAGVDFYLGGHFVGWWDHTPSADALLQSTLQEILAERMADAEVVQAVITTNSEEPLCLGV